MTGKVRLYDYRCFRREAPATLEFSKGFTSFVGPNNSGKSALIRFPYEMRGVIVGIADQMAQGTWTGLAHQMGWNVNHGLYEPAEILCERRYPECSIDFEPTLNEGEKVLSVAKMRVIFDQTASFYRVALFDSDGSELPPLNQRTSHTDNRLTVGNTVYAVGPIRKFLQFLREIQYVGPFRNAINEGAGTHFDAYIGTGFIAQWNQWKTGPNRSQNRASQEVTEDVKRLIGAGSLDISATADGKSLQVVVDGRPHKLQELGAGFSQMVLILANALIKKPSMIVIDEPELHLHPSLQSEFLTTLANYSAHGVMFATHSIGLARQAADQCFTVQRQGHGSTVRPYQRTPQLAEFLGSLGIAGLQELGWNTILLVEGVNDVRTAQALLRLYDKDHCTVVLPLGGDAMANGRRDEELSEVKRLAGPDGKVFALVDSERKEAGGPALKARQRFSDSCDMLEINVCITERRAIENYLTQQSLDAAFAPDRYKALDPYAEQGVAFWGKGESWRAAKHMTKAELAATDLGKFFESM
ncbi:ATP-dependent nuclease [Roseateles sp. DB2]|uniref:ATP-dependent nuclease n=1 Tax=Roseateles sp. DB2 TaxID=3453717 RepID=UPI003EECA88F